MPLPTSVHAYTAEIDAFDRALSDPLGIRIGFPTQDAALHFRHRMHKARSLDRERSRETYTPGDPGYNRSPYDTLVCRIKRSATAWYLYIEPNTSIPGQVEGLSEVETEFVEVEEPKQIEARPPIPHITRRVL